MLTQCPACETLFRVTAAILKMGHGQVRCGKCRTQFDALDNLFDEEESPPVATESPPAASPTAAPSAKASPVASVATQTDAEDIDIDMDIDMDVEIERREPTIDATERAPPAAPDASASVAIQADESEPDIEFDFSEPPVDAPTGEPVIVAPAIVVEDGPPEPLAPVTAATPAKRGFWRRLSGKRAKSADPTVIAAELAELTWAAKAAARKPRTRLWAAISVVLLLALAGQVVHFYRDRLVRDPRFGPTVTRLYHALGFTLAPRWELNAFELQQWGLLTDPAAPNTLRMRATVANRAPFPQPYPLIKLVLKNHADAPVALRAFTPVEYLPERAAADRLLAPEQRANAEIAIVDPGNDAVNFKVSACLRRDQTLVCDDD